MKNFIIATCLSLALGLGSVHAAAPSGKKILMYSQSWGFRHGCVTRPLSGELSHAEKVFKELATKAGYEPSFSQDCNDLKGDGQFNQFDAIIFYTTGNPDINQDAFLKWLRSGKALIGIHCATDTYHHDSDSPVLKSKGWPEYTKIMGAAFKTHNPNDKDVVIKVEDTSHPATMHLGSEWVIADEIYQFKEGSFSRDRVKVLLSIDTAKTDLAPQKMVSGGDYPVSWTNTEGKGRVFYTSLGHRDDVWTNPKWQQHLMGGIGWALAKQEAEK